MKSKQPTDFQKKYAIAVILTDAQRFIQWVNEDFSVITGYALNEVIGKKPNILQGKNTEQDVVERIRRKLEMHISFKEEITNYRKNGEAYPCRLVIHPIFNFNHELTNFIAFEIDASDNVDDSDISLMQLKPKYLTSSLNDLQEFDLYARTITVIEADRLYLNPELKLKTLADLLNTNTRYLSQVINHQSGYNFIQFVNSYRVEEVKKKIVQADYQHLTAYGLAQQCGFKNKSTFYKVFKEVTGITPNDFVAQYHETVPH